MQPTPFTMVRQEGIPDAASNGQVCLMCLDEGGVTKLRRGMQVTTQGPLAEKMLPHLNQLAGELLANPQLQSYEVAARLHALQLACLPPVTKTAEWAFAELDGVRVYTDGKLIYLTRRDLLIGKELT